MLPNNNELQALEEYKIVAKKIRDEYGAKVLFRYDVDKDIIGDFTGNSIRIIEFPSEANVHNWLNDPRYLVVKPLRDKAFSYLSLSILKKFD